MIVKVQTSCESGIWAIRLMIDGEWYNEKEQHIAPPSYARTMGLMIAGLIELFALALLWTLVH